jgi:SH3-like domain-containing protein
LRPILARAPTIARDTALVGRWIRTAGDETVLRRDPESTAVVLAELPRSTAMRVLAAGGDWLRVGLPDGTFGFMPARAAEDANPPLRRTVLAAQVSILAQPDSLAPVIDTLKAGESLAVHGRFRDFYLVRVRDIPVGWIAADDESS